MAISEALSTDLPADNATRLAIYDAMSRDGSPRLTEDQLFERVIPRLRMLVPRELHLETERKYVADKIEACLAAGLLVAEQADDGNVLLTISGTPPQIRFPDGELGDYAPDLEPARERIDRDNAALRERSFDVHEFVPSICDDEGSTDFRALVNSMEEHGFLRQNWIVETADGVVVDGRARKRAAEVLELKVPTVVYPPGREREAARRRDTPLNRVALAIDLNHARLDQGIIDLVHNEVSRVTGRPWDETAADLEITRAWRKVVPKDYVPVLDVEMLAFRRGEVPDVQVTSDGRVMLRSLVVASGLSSYKTKSLESFVAMEMARTKFSSRKALFAKAQDIVDGIAAMKQEQASRKNGKVDPQWDRISEWLHENVPS